MTTAVSAAIDAVRAGMGDLLEPEENRFGEAWFRASPENVRIVMERLKSEFGFDLFLDIGGVDGLDRGRSNADRFDVVYSARPAESSERIHVRVTLGADDPAVDSVSHVWAGANWCEREVFDQFGVRFIGHPNLKRILNHKDFVGHPLRRDYDIKKQQWLSEPDDLMDEMEKERAASAGEEPNECLLINLGPSHPATHGCLRILVDLDGETIRRSVSEIGYLHRGFEKSVEQGTYTHVIPYTDRLNYCSSVLNNVAYCRTVEHMLGIEITPRNQAIRVILSELARIMDHMVCLGACLVDLGALTNFWFLFNEREKIYEVIEALCGARLTHNYIRIGGLAHDLHDDFESGVRGLLRSIPAALADVYGLVGRNRIFLDRVVGVGVISAERAVSYGFTGPCLRASGVANDLRKDEPYYGYDEYDWDVVVGQNGDTHDRLMVRFEEMNQSLRIVEQALNRMPDGPVNVDDKRVSFPPKEDVYGNIEGLMNHFKLVMHGIVPPEGESYVGTEAANGELGFHIVSDGTAKPYRIKVRPPCFMLFSAFGELIRGGMIQDAIAVLGSLNIIAGELDR